MPVGTGMGVVADFDEVVPEGEHVAGDVHFAEGFDGQAFFDQEAFDAVGEIAGGAVAVSAVESGDEDAPVDGGCEFVEVFVAEGHGEDGWCVDCPGGFHFVGVVGVDVVCFQYAGVEYGCEPGGYAFAVEISCAGGFGQVRIVDEGDVVAECLLVQFVQEERVFLLDG